MTRDANPTLKPVLLEAVERALGGDGPAAHRIVQDHDGDAVAAWIHAVVHRMEGDIGNALRIRTLQMDVHLYSAVHRAHGPTPAAVAVASPGAELSAAGPRGVGVLRNPASASTG